jgi:hypothetical protein
LGTLVCQDRAGSQPLPPIMGYYGPNMLQPASQGDH